MATSSSEFLGRYEMMSRLGRGGMAETWRARLLAAEGVTKPVLIKRVLSEYANDQTFISMFISEARISATLSHGNIAQVFDFGRADGEYFLAMEFVDGQPLNRIIKRALKSGLPGIPVPLATFIALEMCRGLHYAHTRKDDKGSPLGIVHRDISPDNVLVSYEGQVKIVDFGIAKAKELRGFHTEPGVVKGKYLFFSPEQARGEEVDARTDVWATGVVLYEMLCGQLPVKGPQYVVQLKLAEGQFPRPRELRPELPEELDDIVMKALTVDVDQRFASAHALGDALTGFLYSTTPRFSSLSVAHLVQELFREDLSAEGREAHVPPTFLEELALWRAQGMAPVTPAAPTPAPAEPPATRSRIRTPLALAGGALIALMGGAVLWSSTRQGTLSLPLPAPSIEVPSAFPPPAPEAHPPTPSSSPPAITSPPTPASSTEGGDKVGNLLEAEQLASQGKELIKQTQFAEAIPILKRCLEKAPTFARCELLLGSAQAKLGQAAEGAKHYRRFLELAPDDPGAPKVRLMLEQYEQSLGGHSRAPNHPDPNPLRQTEEAWFDYSTGAELMKRQEFEDAAGTARACIVVDPRYTRCYSLLGSALMKLGHPAEAARAYRQYLALAPSSDPDVPQVKKLLQDCEASPHEPPPSSPGAAPASSAERSSTRDLAATAITLFRQQRSAQAEPFLRQCLAQDPTVVLCQLYLGTILKQAQRIDEAVKHYRQFLLLAPPSDPSVPPVRKIVEEYDRSRARK